MLTDAQAGLAWFDVRAGSGDEEIHRGARMLRQERKWRQLESDLDGAAGDITVSRWTNVESDPLREEATSPPHQYFIGVALKAARLRLTRGRKTIFEGTMPAGSLYVSAPSQQLSAQFDAPCDFLHFNIAADYFPARQSMARLVASENLNDLVLLRNSFAEQLARTLVENAEAADRKFTHCIGQTLAMHVARLELPQSKVNALPKWRLRRVEEYVRANFDRCVTLSELAKVAGLSRMHFAAQFRMATGYRPREYLLHQRIEHAKSLLSNTATPLAEIALAVGFCTQAHFSTVFKRITRETPARWRCASRNALPTVPEVSARRGFDEQGQELRRVA
ncbi:MAG: helix-turn-helix transcriptional regulator [Bradyrhizobium sp.]|uniref:helix-turn-helix domain-containing protein n=1 Tax=Bradyrhizobium sp. TaxID=376 RepID=UPI001D6599AF|nr:AraC family transcriptional regulator [Bradyrhizobium sp.]MBV9566312.1 helix-turn-helix transcriptional regulator [Bradyrhizobium sp.]